LKELRKTTTLLSPHPIFKVAMDNSIKKSEKLLLRTPEASYSIHSYFCHCYFHSRS